MKLLSFALLWLVCFTGDCGAESERKPEEHELVRRFMFGKEKGQSGVNGLDGLRSGDGGLGGTGDLEGTGLIDAGDLEGTHLIDTGDLGGNGLGGHYDGRTGVAGSWLDGMGGDYGSRELGSGEGDGGGMDGFEGDNNSTEEDYLGGLYGGGGLGSAFVFGLGGGTTGGKLGKMGGREGKGGGTGDGTGGGIGGGNRGGWGNGRPKWRPVPGVQYIGRGYNLVYGNPDFIALGDMSLTEATDPGLRANLILDLTYYTNERHLGYAQPDQVNYISVENCVKREDSKTISGAKSFQKKLMQGFETSSGFEIPGLAAASFSAYNSDMKDESGMTNGIRIFQERRQLCSLASARYRLNNEEIFMKLNGDFMRAVCRLSEDYTDESKKKYMAVIDEFGTSVIVTVILGHMFMERMEMNSEMVMKAMMNSSSTGVTVGAGTGNFQQRLGFQFSENGMDMNTDATMVKNKITWRVGSQNNIQPTKLGIRNLNYVFEEEFWIHCSNAPLNPRALACCYKRTALQNNMVKALEEYASFKKIPPIAADTIATQPLSWPKGFYGLPKTKSGCPAETKFVWVNGSRSQSTGPENRPARGNHWPPHSWGKMQVTQHFCMKSVLNVTRIDYDWPAGTYCIFKKGNCPPGFQQGLIRWDDRDILNMDSHREWLPDGEYDQNTEVHFCCREDAPNVQEMILPSTSPFYLFLKKTSCQRVRGMKVTPERFMWDNSNFFSAFHDRSWQVGGSHPQNDYEGANNILTYCYYEPDLEKQKADAERDAKLREESKIALFI